MEAAFIYQYWRIKMLNQSVLDVLDTFVSERGCLIESVKESGLIDTGTKVLYLERAQNQDNSTFLRSLDKLYNPESENSEELRGLLNDLKYLNALMWDASIEVSGQRKRILDHCFSNLCDDWESVKPELQETIKLRVNSFIQQLRQGQETDVDRQYNLYLEYEAYKSRQPGWRGLTNPQTSAFEQIINDRVFILSMLFRRMRDIEAQLSTAQRLTFRMMTIGSFVITAGLLVEPTNSVPIPLTILLPVSISLGTGTCIYGYNQCRSRDHAPWINFFNQDDTGNERQEINHVDPIMYVDSASVERSIEAMQEGNNEESVNNVHSTYTNS